MKVIFKKSLWTFLSAIIVLLVSCNSSKPDETSGGKRGGFRVTRVRVDDSFWSPKLERWQSVTVNDVFDKFEGKYSPEGTSLEKDFTVMGGTRNAFLNFDLVAQGKRGIGRHHGIRKHFVRRHCRCVRTALRQRSQSTYDCRHHRHDDRCAIGEPWSRVAPPNHGSQPGSP